MFLRRIPTRNYQNIKSLNYQNIRSLKSSTAYIYLTNLRNAMVNLEPNIESKIFIDNEIRIRQMLHNLNVLDSFYVSYHNPNINKHVTSTYTVNIKFKKNGLYIDKCFYGNDPNVVMNDVKTFMHNEIKI